ncbi:MAG: hypothetical protein IJH12_05255 [Clostridia bacterium]|nr:hypothetical protein [Clostridia bacterium]
MSNVNKIITIFKTKVNESNIKENFLQTIKILTEEQKNKLKQILIDNERKLDEEKKKI